MRIKAVVEFDMTMLASDVEDGEEFGIEVEVEKLVGEMVKVKSGEYENLLMGNIVSAEEID